MNDTSAPSERRDYGTSDGPLTREELTATPAAPASAREALAFSMLNVGAYPREEMLRLADQVIVELGSLGFVVVKHDLSQDAYKAGRSDERTFGPTMELPGHP